MKIWSLICLALPLSQCYEQHVLNTYDSEDSTSLDHANKLLRHHPLIDTHNDFPMLLAFDKKGKINDLDIYHLNNSHTDISRIEKGHLMGQFWSVYTECEAKQDNQVLKAMESIDAIKRMVRLHPKTFQLVTSTKQFKKAYRHRRVASMMGMEGGQMIGNSMAALRTFYDLGVRYMTLTHNCHLPWVESCCDPNPPPFKKGTGLTEFGKKIIGEMNRLGMMVDISHVAHSTMNSVLDVTKAPVLFSHSSSYAFCQIERNVPDSVLERLATVDGVVMVNFYNRFVKCGPDATLLDVADHIDHIGKIAGRDKVGIGADFNGIDLTPTGLEDVSKYPDLFAALVERGWTDQELIGLAGKNLLRVWKGVERVRDELDYELPAEDLLEDF
ncbi:renal dipeptidase family [Halteromyces radiatus]|uniref:renal dipeptidase family n=1 Tax=Halteromyces radiatus TaxID=101107 RepID=UPI00221ED5E9|nr:renal dipeptidase family [Halteromyces radiatus]KAI8088901.1 renal dipeptidase family [Halteromyces radiatus]